MAGDGSGSQTPVRDLPIDETKGTAGMKTSRSPSATLNDEPKNGLLGWFKSLGLCRGIARDIRSRAPYYVSDWRDAWNYRVIPAIVLIFFAK